MGGVGSSVNKLRAALTAGFALVTTGKLAQQFSEVAQQGQEIVEASERLGISAQSFQELSFAAKQFNVQQEALRDGLKELTMRADEFATTGAGPAAEAFERLGLTQEQINAQKGDTEELFNTMLRKMQQVDDTAARQRIADELFGGQGGEQLVEFMAQGEQSIEQLRERAQELGVVLDDKALKASQRFARAQKNLGGALRGLRNTAISPLLKQITPLIKRFSEWIANNKELIKQQVSRTFNAIRNAVKEVYDIVKNLLPIIKDIVIAFGAWKLATLAQVTWLNILRAKLAVQKFFQFIRVIKQITRLKKGWAAVQAVLNTVMAANPIGAIITAIAGLVAGIVILIKNWDKVKAALSSFFDLLTTVGEWLEKTFSGILSGIVGWITDLVDGLKNFLGLSEKANKKQGGGQFADQRERQEGKVPLRGRNSGTVTTRTERTTNARVTIRDETGRAEIEQDDDEAPAFDLPVRATG
jgi:hypothetical protein